MWKNINNVLKDKNDYYKDRDLQRDSEIAEELFKHTIEYQKYLIPKKIKYFFHHDKSFFIKLFLKNGCKNVEGFQLRYIYLIDKSCKITVPILPFSEIDKQGAGMYKGEKVTIAERQKKD